jgi:protein-disulfide isomerase
MKIFAGACFALVAAFAVGALVVKKQRSEKLGFLAAENAATFVRPHSPTKGAEDAKVYIVEFTDPACETCAAFSLFLKQAMAAYPGKIKLVIRYAPFHEGASAAVRILEAAKRQGKFWETLDVLYANQRAWTHHHKVHAERIWPLLPTAGVDVERLRKDMSDPAIAQAIQQDLLDAQTLGVRKTPGFFVNGKPLEPFGAAPLRALIEAELAANYPE